MGVIIKRKMSELFSENEKVYQENVRAVRKVIETSGKHPGLGHVGVERKEEDYEKGTDLLGKTKNVVSKH